jgi:hypothetical protein
LKANEHNITFPFFSPLKAIKKRLELKRLWLNSQNKSKAIAPLPPEVFFPKVEIISMCLDKLRV